MAQQVAMDDRWHPGLLDVEGKIDERWNIPADTRADFEDLVRATVQVVTTIGWGEATFRLNVGVPPEQVELQAMVLEAARRALTRGRFTSTPRRPGSSSPSGRPAS